MRLIDADWVISALNIFNDKEHGDEKFLLGIASAKEIVENAPTIEAVSVGTLEQFIWERDIAIGQLNEIGKDLGSKMDDVATVVRCKDCILDREAQCPMKYATEEDDFCSFGERMEDEK